MQQRFDELQAEVDGLQLALRDQEDRFKNSGVEEELARLRQELIRAQQDAEIQRASASSPATAPIDDGLKSVTELVNERVEAIRAELDNRHDERVRQLEESFQKRTDGMKAQLTKKLAQGRETFAAENGEALENLKSGHLEELEKLKVQHQDELNELRRNEASKLATFKETWLAQQSASAVGDNTEKPESEGILSPSSLTDAQARELVSKNSIVRNIMLGNISRLSRQLKEEHDKHLNDQIAEVREKAVTVQGHAVLMETKRNALKLSMAENKAKAMQPKLDIVQRAAQETPQKPVIEVWEIAKVAKPPAPTIGSSAVPSSGPPSRPSAEPSSGPSSGPTGGYTGGPTSGPIGASPGGSAAGPTDGPGNPLLAGLFSGTLTGALSGSARAPANSPANWPTRVPTRVPTIALSASAARQFVPQGNKRQRDDASQGGHSGGDGYGKRGRGGGGGAILR